MVHTPIIPVFIDWQEDFCPGHALGYIEEPSLKILTTGKRLGLDGEMLM